MTDIQLFNNPEFGEIRTVTEGEKTLFCGKDVAKALGYTDTTNAIKLHCRGVVKRHLIDSLGRKQETNFIPEGDVYRLIAHSKPPSAEKFERWVFDEVLPSIRKHGGYIANQEQLTPEELMSRALMVAQKTLAEREARISELTVRAQIMEPKAEYFDGLVDRGVNISIRESAKQLSVKEKTFVGFLLEHKYLYRDKKGKLAPYAQYADDLFVTKECFNDKTNWGGTQTLVTPKGRETFRLLMQGM